MLAKTPAISDHAVLRYLERVRGLDVDELWRVCGGNPKHMPNDHEVVCWLDRHGHNVEFVRASMLTGQVKAAIACGAKSVVIGDHRFIIRNSVVVTVAPLTDFRAMRPCLRKGAARAKRDRHEGRRMSVRDVEMME